MKVPTTGEGRDFLLESALELLRTDAVYYTGHCTGEAQYDVMKSAMGDRLQILSSGIQIEI
jgi:7,8-dihydropterin-6-yl-methyl-4-(beta-D-ribofuranosyl)aminobenzene 5'-phosphate synthase